MLLDKPNPQFGITLALAEAWRLKQHFGQKPDDPHTGKFAVTTCAVCHFIVGRSVARKLNLIFPQWQRPGAVKV